MSRRLKVNLTVLYIIGKKAPHTGSFLRVISMEVEQAYFKYLDLEIDFFEFLLGYIYK